MHGTLSFALLVFCALSLFHLFSHAFGMNSNALCRLFQGKATETGLARLEHDRDTIKTHKGP